MSTLLKKLTLSFLSFLILFSSVAPSLSVRAQETETNGNTWYNQDFQSWFGKVSDQSNPSEIFGERYTSAQVEWVIYGIFAFFINHVTPPGTAGPCISGDITMCMTNIKDYFASLSLQTDPNQNLASVIFADRPLSGVSYFRDKIKNFSLVPIAHAQTVGFGFSALNLIQGMWKSFRDIAFGLFVLVAVVFAFMIMFRIKLSPQTVISVQSALPKIIISLVLVTFSYAIAGFLIDFMYVVIGFVSLVMAPLIPTNWLQPTTYNAASLFNLLTIGPVTKGVGTTASAGGILGILGIYLTPLILLLLILLIIGIALSFTAIGSIPGLIILALIIIVLIIILWMSIKIIWGLFKAFANILLLTIFAPIQLALGSLIPNFGFGQWVKSYLSNLSVFVVTGVLWLFAWIFSIMAWNVAFSGGPTLTLASSGTMTNPWPPLLGTGGGVGTGILFLGVSFVLFTMIPKATELIQSLLSGKPFAYGSGIGEAFGPVGLAYQKTIGPGVAGLQKYGSETMTSGIATSLNELTKPGAKYEKAPQWVKDFLAAASNKPINPYH